jgi:hypothetical protein
MVEVLRPSRNDGVSACDSARDILWNSLYGSRRSTRVSDALASAVSMRHHGGGFGARPPANRREAEHARHVFEIALAVSTDLASVLT